MIYNKSYSYDEYNCELYLKSNEYSEHLDELNRIKDELESNFNDYFLALSADCSNDDLEHWLLNIKMYYYDLLEEISNDSSDIAYANYAYINRDYEDLINKVLFKQDYKNKELVNKLFKSFIKIKDEII